jgi:hypothetical protein
MRFWFGKKLFLDLQTAKQMVAQAVEIYNNKRAKIIAMITPSLLTT